MSKLVIPYGLLNQAATDIKGLKPITDKISNSTVVTAHGPAIEWVPGLVNRDNINLGPGSELWRALSAFYSNWSTPLGNAMDGLDKLGGYFGQVAEAFQNMDASQAAGISASAVLAAVNTYPYNEPGNPTTSYGPGTTTTYTLGGNDPHTPLGLPSHPVLKSETTTVTSDGMTYTETTTFGPSKGESPTGQPVQDTTQVITHADGSTDTITTTIDPKTGAATMTDLNSATGKTTTYTRANWTAPFVDTTPATSSSSSTSSRPPLPPGR